MKSDMTLHHRIVTRTDQNNSFHVSKNIRENQKFAIIYLLSSTADNHRVTLKGEHPDYINAVYVNVSNASLVQ